MLKNFNSWSGTTGRRMLSCGKMGKWLFVPRSGRLNTYGAPCQHTWGVTRFDRLLSNWQPISILGKQSTHKDMFPTHKSSRSSAVLPGHELTRSPSKLNQLICPLKPEKLVPFKLCFHLYYARNVGKEEVVANSTCLVAYSTTRPCSKFPFSHVNRCSSVLARIQPTDRPINVISKCRSVFLAPLFETLHLFYSLTFHQAAWR